mgnify:CR=1 FL=1
MLLVCLVMVLIAFLPNINSIDALGQIKGPRVYIIQTDEDKAVLDKAFQTMLPTGYSRISEKDVPRDFLPGDSKALFSLNPGFTDMDDIMRYAREKNLEEIYFIPVPLRKPGDPLPPISQVPNSTNIFTNNFIRDISDFNFMDFIVKSASADNVPGPNCSTGTLYPGGQCFGVGYCVDDDPNDGYCSTVRVCLQYAARECHWFGGSQGMYTHTLRNVYFYDAHDLLGIASVVDSMKAHNSDTYIYYPRLLIVDWYKTDADTGAACGNSNGVRGCAPNCWVGDPTTSCLASYPECNKPLRNPLDRVYNKHIYVSQLDRNDWGAVRHETLHQYGFGHAHIDKDLKRSAHAIDAKKGGPCNPPGGQPNGPDEKYY